jgi:hypothetical protein
VNTVRYQPTSVLRSPLHDIRVRLGLAAAQVNVRLHWSVVFLLSYLAAITIIGKGPTYFGVPPLYWGEMVMVTSLIWIAPWREPAGVQRPRYGSVAVLVAVFMAYATVLTAVSIPRYGLEAIRDAAIWYYAAFFFVGVSLACRQAVADRVWRLFQVFWVLSLIWGAANFASGENLSKLGPLIPWRGVPVLFNSTHESGQNLGLGAIIVLCLLPFNKHPFWGLALKAYAVAGLAIFAVQEGRGMRVGFAAGCAIVLSLVIARGKPLSISTKLAKLSLLALPAILMAAILMPERFLKATQLDRFAQARPSDAEGTAYWRLIWWQRLQDEVMRRNPAFGLGFGESLHLYHPLLESIDDPFVARSPHNINVTVFTRMGLAGLALWALTIAIGIGYVYVRAYTGRTSDGKHYSPERRNELAFWTMMTVATFVNSSFGVLMEGPVLGIWFWFALGFAYGRTQSPGGQEGKLGMLAALRSLRLQALVHRPA